MAFCPRCNAPVPDGAQVCTNCGNPLYQPQNTQNQYYNPNNSPYFNPNAQQQTPPVAQQPQVNYNNPYNPYNQNVNMNALSLQNDISNAKTLGIVAIVLAFFFQLASIICGAIGISKANSVINYARQTGDMALLNAATDAKRYNKIGITLSIVFVTIAVVFYIVAMVIGIASMGDM